MYAAHLKKKLMKLIISFDNIITFFNIYEKTLKNIYFETEGVLLNFTYERVENI
jgi:hypothetical protein